MVVCLGHFRNPDALNYQFHVEFFFVQDICSDISADSLINTLMISHVGINSTLKQWFQFAKHT